MSESLIKQFVQLGAVGGLIAVAWRLLDILSRQTAALEKIAETYAGQ